MSAAPPALHRIALNVWLVCLLGLASGGCWPSRPPAQLWTNFAYTRGADGRLRPEGDTTWLPAPVDYEAIVKADTAYWYVRDLGARGKSIYDPIRDRGGDDFVVGGDFVYGDGDYFQYWRNWSSTERKNKVAVAKLSGADSKLVGDCVRFDERHIVVVDGSARQTYDYDLQPVEARPDLACDCAQKTNVICPANADGRPGVKLQRMERR